MAKQSTTTARNPLQPTPVPASPPPEESGHRNEVTMAGRLTTEPAMRELPSGDRVVTWRIAVTRPVSEQRRNQRLDAITCVTFDAAVQAETREWRIGDVVSVSGSLHRRFWRSQGGSTSVFEVEAKTVSCVEEHDRLPGLADAHQRN